MNEPVENLDGKLDLSRPTGFRDLMPADMRQYRQVETKIRQVIEGFGFEEIRTPMVEFLDLFLVRSGEKFKEDSFTFTVPTARNDDASEEDRKLLVLRPEFTAGVCRFFIQNHISRDPKPVKIYYIGPCFRYDKPAPGRYREFVQVGVEILGARGAAADAEVLIVAMKTALAAGIQDAILRINDLNILRALLKDFAIKDRHQDEIIALMDKANGDTIKATLGVIDADPASIRDELDRGLDQLGVNAALSKILQEFLSLDGAFKQVSTKARQILESCPLAMNALDETPLGEIEGILQSTGIDSFKIDLSLARGLDYYTGVVFEIDSPCLGKQKQVCGGGRYDNLVAEFGGEDIPATGFALGLDRYILAAREHGSFDEGILEKRAFVFLYCFHDALLPNLFKIQERFISAGIPSEINLMGGKVRRALSFASKKAFDFAIILGDKEAEQDMVTVKDLKTGDQELLNVTAALDFVNSRIDNQHA
ncbi:histidine--tRNA ligase [Candidatus Bathyarchaeota archaeon]|nr:histidine--tRNA ligase [Candidatus Bathyarchaeota archaeon]